MKILQFNTYDFGSTGFVMKVIKESCFNNDIECINCFIYAKKNNIVLNIYQKIISLITKISGYYGFINRLSSKRLIKKIKLEKPDIVVLHNFHDNSIDCKTLLTFLAKSNIKTVIILHDCWSFTGYCPHFLSIKCDKWKTKCEHCSLKSNFSWFFDRSSKLFQNKMNLLNNLNLHLVAISSWMLEQCKMSFLNSKSVSLITNPVNLNDFKYQKVEKNNEKKIVLGVAFDWSLKKGSEDFNFLADNLPDNYVVKIVGVTKKTKSKFNKKIQMIPRVESKEQLAFLYSSASVFVNASKEESFGLTNIEAQACGTPVVTYDAGGCSDTISQDSGILVKTNKKEDLLKAVLEITNAQDGKYKKDQCINFAMNFDSESIGKKYIELFRMIENENINN